jgi:two-component system, chemotaxis family, chemotaxis protein CheY
LRYDHLRILVVDDNQHIRTLIGEIVRAIGVSQIFEASDGVEALQVIRGRDVDVVITDLSMEPLDGIAFVKLLRNSPDSPNPQAPVIMMTGHSTRKSVADARDAGVNELLVKPLTARGVIERLQRVMEHPRTFVRTTNYFGPDRRRRSDPGHGGPWRRTADAHA